MSIYIHRFECVSFVFYFSLFCLSIFFVFGSFLFETIETLPFFA